MVSKKSAYVLVFAVFWAACLWGQQYTLRSYSVSSGLAQSQVYAICEDARGVLWFGTQGGGISKFDGISFVNLTSRDGLVNDYIGVIQEDQNGNIWIGTDGGVSRFDGQSFTQSAALREDAARRRASALDVPSQWQIRLRHQRTQEFGDAVRLRCGIGNADRAADDFDTARWF